jgi:hypothetical protein
MRDKIVVIDKEKQQENPIGDYIPDHRHGKKEGRLLRWTGRHDQRQRQKEQASDNHIEYIFPAFIHQMDPCHA